MEGKGCSSSKTHDCGERVAAERLKGVPKLGEVIWVKISRDFWWPAVVVESNTNRSNKADDGLMGDVLVRLYGSYEYMYVDPIKWCSEFQITLEQNNGCYQQIFQKALEQDRSSLKSGRVKMKVTKSKDGVQKQLNLKCAGTKETEEHDRSQKRLEKNKQGAAAVISKSPKKHGKEKHEPNSPRTAEGVKGRSSKQIKDASLSGRSQELNARRTKVMQTLGLIAPPGSPFLKMNAFV